MSAKSFVQALFVQKYWMTRVFFIQFVLCMQKKTMETMQGLQRFYWYGSFHAPIRYRLINCYYKPQGVFFGSSLPTLSTYQHPFELKFFSWRSVKIDETLPNRGFVYALWVFTSRWSDSQKQNISCCSKFLLRGIRGHRQLRTHQLIHIQYIRSYVVIVFKQLRQNLYRTVMLLE